LLFTAEDVSDIQVDIEEALKLNGVERNANDIEY
jgi:hypothetical protein